MATRPTPQPNADKFVWDSFTLVTPAPKKTKPKDEKALTYREKLALLLGDFEGHPFRGNQWTDSGSGGSASEGGRTASSPSEPHKDYETFEAAKQRHREVTARLDKKYNTDKNGYLEEFFTDPEYLASKAQLQEAQRVYQESEAATPQPPSRTQALRDRVNDMAQRTGFDPQRVNIHEGSGREFEVAGRKLTEGGHYNPRTGDVQLNIDELTDSRDREDGTRNEGLIQHEIMHAMQDGVAKVAAAEHDEIRNSMPSRTFGEGGAIVKEQAGKDYDRLFGKNGYPRKGAIAEIEKRWPASAAMAKGHPDGDSYLGTWTQDADGKWQFDEDELSARRDAMDHDGPTEYSQLYWEALSTSPLARHAAIQETLADTARYQHLAPKGEQLYRGKAPSHRWQRFAEVLREVYPAIRTKEPDRMFHRPLPPPTPKEKPRVPKVQPGPGAHTLAADKPTRLQRVTIGGKDGWLAFLDADGDPVLPSSPEAVSARAVFEDGSSAVYAVAPHERDVPKELSSIRHRLLLGDFEGHPFRGNQWTDSSDSGGSDKAGRPVVTTDKRLGTTIKAPTDEQLDLITKTAESTGFDPWRVKIDVVDKTFKVGGTTYEQMGSYNPETGIMTVNAKTMVDMPPRELAGLVAHETTHHAWKLTKGSATREAKAFRSFMKDNRDALEKEDGVSSYSRAYWSESRSDAASAEKAVNETLAEISYLIAEAEHPPDPRHPVSAAARLVKLSPIWRDAHAKLLAGAAAERAKAEKAAAKKAKP